MQKAIPSPSELLQIMLKKHKLNGSILAKALNANYASVNQLLNGKIKITVPMALRLAKYFNTAPEYWLVYQMKHDIALAEKDKELCRAVKAIKKFSKQPAPKRAAKRT